MELVFFVARPEEALGVASIDDLPDRPAADPLAIDGPEVLLALGPALGFERSQSVRRVRDTTCQSFPVWAIAEPVCEALAALDDDAIDSHAKGWHTTADADLFERSSCLASLREALRRRTVGEQLFAVLQERVL